MQEKGVKFDAQGNILVDNRACAGVRADLKNCLLRSDCVKKGKKTPRECLQVNDASVPMECQVLRNLLFECKRSMGNQLPAADPLALSNLVADDPEPEVFVA